jgi:hypothetical protein
VPNRQKFGTILVVLLCIGIGALGCAEDCMDCGECGLVGGPNQGDRIAGVRIGAAPDGTPTAELSRYVDGQCAGAGSFTFWVQRVQGELSVVPRPSAQQLDTEAATLQSSGPGAVYLFNDALQTQLRYEWLDTQLRLEIKQGADTITALCSLAEPNAIACVE